MFAKKATRRLSTSSVRVYPYAVLPFFTFLDQRRSAVVDPSTSLAPGSWPDWLECMDGFPMTPTGKVRKFSLRELLRRCNRFGGWPDWLSTCPHVRSPQGCQTALKECRVRNAATVSL